MPDRVLRDELWESERFLDLPTDSARLAFIRFVNLADDFGNFEGGQRRIFRMLHACTQVKTENASAEIIDALMGVDLIRRYEVDGRELFHVPRLRPHRQYLTRKMPASPWDEDRKLGKNRRVVEKGLAKDQVLKSESSNDMNTTSHARSNDVAEGVGVGVGVGEILTPLRESSGTAKKPPCADPSQFDFKNDPPPGKEALYVLAFLNKVTGSKFQPVEANMRLVRMRLREYTPAELKQMIVCKKHEWSVPNGDFDGSKYLTPSTLFAASNCAKYVEQARKEFGDAHG